MEKILIRHVRSNGFLLYVDSEGKLVQDPNFALSFNSFQDAQNYINNFEASDIAMYNLEVCSVSLPVFRQRV